MSMSEDYDYEMDEEDYDAYFTSIDINRQYDIIKEIRQKLDKIRKKTASNKIRKYVSDIDLLLSQLIEEGE